MALKTYLYRAEGVSAFLLQPLLASGASPVVGEILSPSLTPITIDEIHKEDLDAAMEDFGYEFESEYTDAAPLVGRKDYGVLAADPTSPTPSEGDYYYNSGTNLEQIYDGVAWVPQEGGAPVTLNAGGTTQDSANLVGQELELVLATTTTDGVMSATDKTKLDGIETGANDYTHPNHSGDVTSVGDGSTTISNNAVSNPKLADMGTQTLKGRTTAGTGDPEDLTPTQVRTMLNIEDGSTEGIVAEDEGATVTGGPHTTINFVGAGVTATNAGAQELTVTIPGGVGSDELVKVSANDTTAGYLLGKVVAGSAKISITEVNDAGDEDLSIDLGTVDTDDIPEGVTNLYNATHTGEVTGATALTIATDVVDNTNLSNMATQTIKGRTTAGTGDPEDLTVIQVRTMLNIENGAAADQNLFESVSDGVNTATADSATDTLTVTGTEGVDATVTPGTDTLTLSLDVDGLAAEASPDGAADFLVIYDVSVGSHRKVLLDNIPGTQDPVTLNVGTTTQESANLSGQELELVLVTTTTDGVMSATDKTKLDGIDSGANNYAHPNHTGDVTSVGDGAQTIVVDVVDNTKLSNMATQTIKGRTTAGSGDPEDLTPTQVRTMLNIEDGATVGVIAEDEGVTVVGGPHTTIDFVGAGVSATNAGGGQVTVTIPGGAGSDELVKVSANDTTAGYLLGKVVAGSAKISITEVNDAGDEDLSIDLGTVDTDDIPEGVTNLYNATHTGEVTGATALTIAVDVVDNTNLSNMPALTIKGNDTGGVADPKDLTVAEAQTLLNIEDGSTEGVVAEDEGVTVTGGPHVTINFVGAGVTATNAGAQELTVTIPGGVGADELVKVSANDTTAGYLLGKIVAGSAKISITEINNGGDEDLSIDLGTVDSDDIPEGVTNLYNATHTGEVTGATVLTIATDVVDNTNLSNMATQTIKGRTTAGTGDPEDLTVTQVRTMLNIEDGAAADQSLFETISDGVNSAVADSATDTLTVTGTEGVDATVTPASDTLTLSLDVNGLTTEAVPDGAADFLVIYDVSVGSHRKVLLDNLPDSHDPVTLSVGTTTQEAANLVGQELELVVATTTTDGVMSATDKTKLDGIDSGANNYSHPNHTGDVTSVGDGAQTIAVDVVSNTKLSNMPANTLKGNDTGGVADPQDLTVAEAQTLLNIEDGANNYTHPNHSGDVTSVGDGAQTITADAVTNTKLANMATLTLKGNDTGISADPQDLTVAEVQTLLNIEDGANDYTHPNHSGDVTSVGDGSTTITADAVTNTKLANMATQTIKGRTTAGSGDPEDLTAAQVRTLINVEDGANNYSHPNHTGDVTSTGDGATTIVADVVDNTRLSNMPALTIKGNDTGGSTDPQDLTVAEAQTLLNIEDGATNTPLTASAPVNVTKAVAVVGVATDAARADHKHDITTATAIALTDATNAEGVSTSLARADHTHSHGARGGGTLHANFVGDTGSGGTAGFVIAPATGDAPKFLKGDGTWTAVPGGGDMLAATYDPTAVGGDAFDADNHVYSNVTSGMVATDTQAAIDEIESRVDTLEGAGHDAVTLNAGGTTQDSSNLVGQELELVLVTTTTDGVMSAADKTKLDGIATGAAVDQDLFSAVSDGVNTATADSTTDTLTVTGTEGIDVTVTPGSDTVTTTLDINGLTADATPNGAADYVATWDASAGTHKKVLLDDLPGGGGGGESQATEILLGIAEIATQAETDAGTDDLRIVTPLKLANHPQLPTQDENDALVGSSGTPSSINPYLTEEDPRVGEGSGVSGPIMIAMSEANIPYKKSTSNSFENVQNFIWPGSDAIGVPSSIKAIVHRSGGTAMNLKIGDITNATTIAEKLSITDIVPTIVDLGALGNVTSTEAIWSIQMSRVGGGATARVSSVLVAF